MDPKLSTVVISPRDKSKVLYLHFHKAYGPQTY